MEMLVLNISYYDFQDEAGNQRKGVNLVCAETDVLQDGNGRTRGASVVRLPGDISLWEKFRELPGVYRVETSMRPGRDMRPALHCVGGELVKRINFGKSQ